MLSYLTEIDGNNHFALIATERDLPDRLVAVARFVRYHDHPTEAEFAITVHDPYQGQGIGRRLLELLVEAARERGITRLRALIQSDNDPMTRLLRRVLPQARLEDRSDGECTYSADIAVVPPRTGTSSISGDHRRKPMAISAGSEAGAHVCSPPSARAETPGSRIGGDRGSARRRAGDPRRRS
jgi:GNAT superfamily N-acetyltransferase